MRSEELKKLAMSNFQLAIDASVCIIANCSLQIANCYSELQSRGGFAVDGNVC